MRGPIGHHARLIELARAKLDPGANAERVVLAAARAQRRELDPARQPGSAALVAEQAGTPGTADDEVLVSILVHITDDDARTRLQSRGEQRGAVLEPARAVVAQEEHAAAARCGGCPGDDEVEPPVIVAVHELGRRSDQAAQAPQRPC